MKVMLYKRDERLGMSQGMAIEAIVKRIGGSLANCGEVINENGGQTGQLYLHTKYAQQATVCSIASSESIWDDTGNEVTCVFRRTNDNPWEQKTDDGWETRPMMQDELEFINLADARAMQRIGNDLNRGLGLIGRAVGH